MCPRTLKTRSSVRCCQAIWTLICTFTLCTASMLLSWISTRWRGWITTVMRGPWCSPAAQCVAQRLCLWNWRQASPGLGLFLMVWHHVTLPPWGPVISHPTQSPSLTARNFGPCVGWQCHSTVAISWALWWMQMGRSWWAITASVQGCSYVSITPGHSGCSLGCTAPSHNSGF